jgi:hypothetical protein
MIKNISDYDKCVVTEIYETVKRNGDDTKLCKYPGNNQSSNLNKWKNLAEGYIALSNDYVENIKIWHKEDQQRREGDRMWKKIKQAEKQAGR